MRAYTQDRLIAALRAERDAANARAEALLTALARIATLECMTEASRINAVTRRDTVFEIAAQAAREARG